MNRIIKFTAFAVLSCVAAQSFTTLNAAAAQDAPGRPGVPPVFEIPHVDYDEDAYNRLRHGEKNMQKANLKNAILSDLDLKDVDFREANLEGAIFKGNPSISGVKFDRANLTNANFVATRVTNIGNYFENANLSHANFTAAELDGVEFKKTTLQEAIFEEATITNCKFTNIMAPAAEGVNFHQANIIDCKFNIVELSNANFDHAAIITRNTLCEFIFCSFRKANFNCAKLIGARFTDTSVCDFEKAKNLEALTSAEGTIFCSEMTSPQAFFTDEQFFRIRAKGGKFIHIPPTQEETPSLGESIWNGVCSLFKIGLSTGAAALSTEQGQDFAGRHLLRGVERYKEFKGRITEEERDRRFARIDSFFDERAKSYKPTSFMDKPFDRFK